MATRTTAKTAAKANTNDECVIKCNPHRELACGYTDVQGVR